MMLPENSCERANVVTGGRRRGRGRGWKTGRVTPNLPHWAMGGRRGEQRGRAQRAFWRKLKNRWKTYILRFKKYEA